MSKIKTMRQRAIELPCRAYFSKILPDYKLTEIQIQQITLAFEYYNDRSTYTSTHERIATIIKVNPTADIHKTCVDIDKTKPHSIEYFQALYGHSVGTQMFLSRNIKLSAVLLYTPQQAIDSFYNRDNCSTTNRTPAIETQLLQFNDVHKLTKLTFDDVAIVSDIIEYFNATDIINRYSICKEYPSSSIEYHNARYSKQRSHEIRYKQSQTYKQNFPTRIEYWMEKGFSYEHSIDKVRTIQSERSNNVKNRLSHYQQTYWMNKGYSDDEATSIISNLQIRDYNYFIEKYGMDEGNVRYISMIKSRHTTFNKRPEHEKLSINKSKGRTFDQLIIEHGLDKALSIVQSRCQFANRSSRESELFFMDVDCLDYELKKHSITSYKGDEWWVKHDSGLYFVDYIYNNKIVEYYGSFWHGDLRMFEIDDIHPVTKKTIREMRECDDRRINTLRSKGFEVKIIWSDDITTHTHNDILQDIYIFLKG